MRVRCSSCGAEYETRVTRAALGLVARCERCGRTALRALDADDDAATDAPPGPVARRRADRPNEEFDDGFAR